MLQIVHRPRIQVDILGVGLGEVPHAKVGIMSEGTHRISEVHNMLHGIFSSTIELLKLEDNILRSHLDGILWLQLYIDRRYKGFLLISPQHCLDLWSGHEGCGAPRSRWLIAYRE